MNIIRFSICLTFLMLKIASGFAQVSVGANNGTATDYLGWDNTMTGVSLKVAHEDSDPIDFFTSSGSTFDNLRMRIYESTILAPNATPFNVARVGIVEDELYGWSAWPDPVSLLHIGHGWQSGAGGHRTWMDVGTFGTAGTDMTYFGLKNQFFGNEGRPWGDFMDAVVSWGDNDDAIDSFNDLRFIFTVDQGMTGSGDAATDEGLEVARMSWNGNVGIGSFRHPTNMMTPVRPARRLEVVDRRPTPDVSFPQLRLTFEPDNDVFSGTNARWTDFEATPNGDLYINPSSRTNGNGNVGINTRTPQATLEINSNSASASPGASGLKLTDLWNTSTSISTSNGKVLSVDSDGDVILVDDNGTFCPGGSPANYLIKNTGGTSACSSGVYEVPSTQYVGIGTISPAAKLHSYISNSGANMVAGFFELTNTNTATATTTIGVSSLVNSASSGNSNIWGMHGRVIAASNQSVVGGYFKSEGSGNEHYGVSGSADGASGTNYGVNGGASNSGATNNYGVYGRASNASTMNYGIYGNAPQSGTIGYFNAAAFFVGNIYGTTGNFSSSDVKFKQNVQPLINATNILTQLSIKSYEFDLTGYPSMNFPSGTQYGLIAQDVEPIIPGMVKTFRNPQTEVNGVLIPEVDFKAMSYETLIPILVAGFQEQKQVIDSLQIVLANYIGQPRTSGGSNDTQQRITLSNQKGIILQQNDPNPFAESTIIRFVIPESVSNARIMFTDTKGAVLKSAVIESRGEGSLEVFASDLSSGLYTYTLLCDGKVIDSKKMIKQ